MKEAIERLRQLAEDNNHFADQLETNKQMIPDTPIDRVERLIRTYRYWNQCLLIAAWLLESEK